MNAKGGFVVLRSGPNGSTFYIDPIMERWPGRSENDIWIRASLHGEVLVERKRVFDRLKSALDWVAFEAGLLGVT